MSRKNGTILTEVVDDGIGLEEHAQASVFEPFSQPNRCKEGGTGLGLALVKQHVLLHHGQVGVNSKHDHGATFWFAIPEQFEKTNQTEEPDESFGTGSG